MIYIYDKKVVEDGVECLDLVVFPPNEKEEKVLNNLYTFAENCGVKLGVETKIGISCNSNHNYQEKTVGSFPSSFLTLRVTEGKNKIYTYYIDLKEDVTDSDITKAFKRVKEDLLKD